MTDEQIKMLVEAMTLPIDRDMMWDINLKASGRAGVQLYSVSKDDFGYTYSHHLAEATGKTLADAMSKAWLEWEHSK